MQEDAQYAVGLAARFFGNAFGHFFLDHAYHFGDAVFVVEYLEEYLRGNVVREVAYHPERAGEYAFQGEAQEVGLQQAALQAREMSEKVIDGFAVQFDRFQVDVVPLQQVLRQDSHSRADFQNVAVC